MIEHKNKKILNMTTTEFTEMLTRFDVFLYNFAFRLTENAEKAKDLVQDTLLRAFRYKDKYKMGTNFKGWIATIMRNTFINQYRKEKKRRTVSKPVEDFAFALESKMITPNAGEVNLRLQELESMLNQISDIYRIPFLMYFRGYEYKDIAAHADIPLGTVKSRIYTARKKMKTLIRKNNI
jgi:RNA polymerase sigma factor (sigma-70 family)